MGTAVVVDMRAIEAARLEALRLLTIAYTPQPVKQPDGGTLHLCLSGRIARAYDKLAIARRADNAAAIAKIEPALKALRSQYEAACAAAENAASNWAALATAQGVTVDPASIYPPTCQCDACTAQRAYQSHQGARAIYTSVLYEFAAPTSATTPPLVDLVRQVKAGDTAANRQLWIHLGRILDAANLYMAACTDAGVSPNWRLALYPGGEE